MSSSNQEKLYVVIVDFLVKTEHAEKFGHLIAANALASRTLEDGCIQFDVCRPADDNTRFFLYELYKDEAAFREHLETTHFKEFDARVGSWVADKRVQILSRVSP